MTATPTGVIPGSQMIVARTKIAIFGPGQFKFVLAKTEIAVFGPGQHHPARGGEIAII